MSASEDLYTGGTAGSNPVPSSAQSVSAGHLTAIAEEAGTLGALAHSVRREKGRAASKPAFLSCLSLAGIDAVPRSNGWAARKDPRPRRRFAKA
jgi:hypothetical protein